MDYKRVKQVEKEMPPMATWPFVKREPYRDENEFRIIYARRKKSQKTITIGFDLSCINRITLSPWLARPIAENIAQILKKLPGCKALKIKKSTLLENRRWRKAISPNDASEAQ